MARPRSKLAIGCLLGLIGMMGWSPIHAAGMTHVVINQIQIDGLAGSGGASQDWVELFNPTTQAVDLSGWKLRKRTQTGTESSVRVFGDGQSIPAFGFFLWANSLDGFAVGLGADEASTVTLAANNSIALVDQNDNMVDAVAWGSEHVNPFAEGTAAANPDEAGALERLAQDTDNNLADFIPQTSPHPKTSHSPPVNPPALPPPASPTSPALPTAPTGSVTPTYSTAIIINEFLPNPDGPDDGEEWIELYNNSETQIDLTGWILDDEAQSGGGIGSSAQTLEPGITIAGRGYRVVHLAESAFALNNTGGDKIRLFWPNKQLAAEVVYAQSAKDDYTYARRLDGAYEWTRLVTKNAANLFDPSPVAQPANPQNQPAPAAMPSGITDKIKINEFLPDPAGSDSGQEWVELLNTGLEPVPVHNWILDDGESAAAIGTTAWKIQSPTIPPGGLAVLVIPAGKFALNNSGGDTLRLFDPNRMLADWVDYPSAEAGRSFQKQADGDWVWGEPSPNATNPVALVESVEAAIVIHEIFPEPELGGEEFIELKNLGSEDTDLTGWRLSDLAGGFTIRDAVIPALGFWVVMKSESKLALNNYGLEAVTLTDPQGQIIDEVEYEDPPKNQSYNYVDEQEYAWSAMPTPGADNQIAPGQIRGAALPRTGTPGWVWVMFAGVAPVWYIMFRKDECL